MKKLYYVRTENRFNQVLVFTSKNKARQWLRQATKYDKEKIEESIIETYLFDNYFNIFPQTI